MCLSAEINIIIWALWKVGAGAKPGQSCPLSPLTWCLVQLLQHGEETVVEKELHRPRCLGQQPPNDGPQLLAHQAVGIIWDRGPT